MTREEAIANLKMIRVAFVDPGTKEQRKLIDDTFEMAIQALPQEPCTDTVSIRKDILKCRVGNIVAYNVEWLKKHWQMEMDIVCGVKPCEDAISREAVYSILKEYHIDEEEIESAMDDCQNLTVNGIASDVSLLPSVTQKSGKCKNCKYFEYDSVAKVDGIPLIVAHEVCNKWGGGCKTSEDGYCYLFEPQESEEQTE